MNAKRPEDQEARSATQTTLNQLSYKFTKLSQQLVQVVQLPVPLLGETDEASVIVGCVC